MSEPSKLGGDAIVDLSHRGDAWLAPVLGLRVVVRALLSVQQAGVEKAYLIGEGAEEAARLFRKHSAAKMTVEVVTSEPPETGHRRLMFRTPVVVHHATLRTLSERAGGLVVDVPVALPEGYPGFLVPARDAAERMEANRAIRRSIRKPMQHSGLLSVYMVQPISLQICRVLSRTPITPNQLTIIGLLINLASLPLLWDGGRTEIAIAAILLMVNNFVDQFDGVIARMKVQSSPFGAQLDNTADNIFKISMLPAMGTGLTHQTGQDVWMIVGWTAGIGRLIYWCMMQYYLRRFGGPGASPNIFRFWYRVPRDGAPPLAPPRPGDEHVFHVRFLLRKDFMHTAYFVFGLAHFLHVPFLLQALGAIEYGALAIVQLTLFHRRFVFHADHRGRG